MIALIDGDLVGITAQGYKRISMGKGIRQLEHRVKAEKVLKRKLKFKEHVHHLDYNKLNNANTNLIICTSSYHTLLHARTDVLLDGYHPDLHHYCTSCKQYHFHNAFPKNKFAWNGLHNMCKLSTNKVRRGKGYGKFEWKERMQQQTRRAIQRQLASSLVKAGRCL